MAKRQKQLEAIRDRNWTDACLSRLRDWPEARLEQLQALLVPSTELNPQVQRGWRVKQTIELFEELDDVERLKLWEALFPKLGRHLAQAWQDRPTRPYQTGAFRRPFRAPGRKPLHLVAGANAFVLVCDKLWGIDEDPAWLAAWAPFIHVWLDRRLIPSLLGTVLRAGGEDAEAVRRVLVDSMHGDHEIGEMGQHVVIALLNSSVPEDWQIIGKLLLAAQRQEGLRQAILEAVDEAEPGAFDYMLALILEHDLSRFSATGRALDVWLGTQWAEHDAGQVAPRIARLRAFLDDQDARAHALAHGSAEDAYLALWSLAYRDADAALEPAAEVMRSEDPERRYAGFRLLEQTYLYPESFVLAATPFIEGREPDQRMQMAIAERIGSLRFEAVSEELFQATADLFYATPKRKETLAPILWPWAIFNADRRAVAAALRALATGAPEKLIPFVPALDASDCANVIAELAGFGWEHSSQGRRRRERRELSPEARRLMLELACDTRQAVQAAAFEALRPLPVESDEVEVLLANLHRSAATLRQGAIARLGELEATQVLEVAGTLLGDKNVRKRAAGLELAAGLVEQDRAGSAARDLVAVHRETLGSAELEDVADELLALEVKAVGWEDCLGLVPPGSRCPLLEPVYVGVSLRSEASAVCLRELAALFLAHGDTELELPGGELGSDGTTQVLLSESSYGFPRPLGDADIHEQAEARLPLAEIWLDWLENRDAAARDDDGLELLRAWQGNWRSGADREQLPPAFMSRGVVGAFEHLLSWMVALSQPAGAGALLVQYVEDLMARPDALTDEEREAERKRQRHRRYGTPLLTRIHCWTQIAHLPAVAMGAEHRARMAQLQILAAERGEEGCGEGPTVDSFAAAYDAGLLNDRDFVWLLLHPRRTGREKADELEVPARFGPIAQVTGLRGYPAVTERPGLVAAVQALRDRLIELELTRGERLGPASRAVGFVRHAGGTDAFFRLVRALGRDRIVRQDQWGAPTRGYSLSRLIARTTPFPDDTPEVFAARFRDEPISEARLLELALYAPQWARHVEHALGEQGLEEVIWWIHAHTKSSGYWRDREFRDLWAVQVNERTHLDASDLEEGAVDVQWFRDVLKTVGPKRWRALQKPAKYASNSGGHKRAQLFADAMLGEVDASALLTRIDEKRHQDSVRAYGLVPLPKTAKAARLETLARYERLQAFLRESRSFGSQRQASEGRAVEIALQNLASTAGYRDPRRLQWAMEAEAVADLAKGPVTVEEGDTTVSLALDADGAPALSVRRKDKLLKDVPAKLRKVEAVAALRGRVKDLRNQRARMAASLETAMTRGDEFTGREIRGFFEHPMLRPFLEQLVLIMTNDRAGYPTAGGRSLRALEDAIINLGAKDKVRIAHPLDLLRRGDWPDWQRECFAAERVQPFKQVFREVYPKTETELSRIDMTRRYAGHQVNPRQALALLKQRDWIFAPEEGVRRVYHDERLVAELWFQEHFYTPAEVEGLTLEGVSFRQKDKDRKTLLIEAVPERTFSEAMRDVDLVVSVAHAGGVDPEASASTVTMRATLLRETCALLGLDNVQVEGHHALIEGKRGRYSVHLGSATTMVRPGRTLLIVAVHGQQRGRLFLPFADNDPKTAEVLSKTLLLARDEEIKDPAILASIRG